MSSEVTENRPALGVPGAVLVLTNETMDAHSVSLAVHPACFEHRGHAHGAPPRLRIRHDRHIDSTRWTLPVDVMSLTS